MRKDNLTYDELKARHDKFQKQAARSLIIGQNLVNLLPWPWIVAEVSIKVHVSLIIGNEDQGKKQRYHSLLR